MPPIVTDLSAETLARELETFLAEHPGAAVLEDGRALFDMREARYALSAEHGRCVLQLWSEERNIVRTVTGLDVRKDALRLQVRRFGQTRPQMLHLLADRDQRTPSTRAATRSRYLKQLVHMLPRAFGDWKIEALRSSMDLEHSFGPAYARGLLTRGQSAWALIAVNAEESQATIDGILTLGLLWLRRCREREGSRRHVEGLRVIVPEGHGAVTQSRMGWLDAAQAKWELYECDARGDELRALETGRNGNLEMRLVQAFDSAEALERLRNGIEQVMALVPEGARERVERRVHSASAVGLSLYGLEFAHVQHGLAPGSFQRQDRITFGAGPSETELNEETVPILRQLTSRLFESRHTAGSARDPLYRMQPERWLESRLSSALREIEHSLLAAPVYRQVPAFAASDRGMLDLLAMNRDGRLAVVELKADEDLHMVLQGLDYWIRVHRAAQSRRADGSNDFTRSGYFPGMRLADMPPLLYFIAPALRIHTATETVLSYLSQEIEWNLIAVGEDWRRSLEVIWRKRGAADQPS
ncbi:MAG TPA: hypothetical protein VGM02_13795 [Acidobacteriaceae bacterium]|jgi:hypothetical protein